MGCANGDDGVRSNGGTGIGGDGGNDNGGGIGGAGDRRGRGRAGRGGGHKRAEGMHAAGLQYGPAFRTLECGHLVTKGGDAVGVLRRRSQWEGTRVHPADLDGGLQFMSVLAPMGEAHGGETRLPFAVDEARLRGAMVRALTAVHGGLRQPPLLTCLTH